MPYNRKPPSNRLGVEDTCTEIGKIFLPSARQVIKNVEEVVESAADQNLLDCTGLDD